jgi:hypothetical protein
MRKQYSLGESESQSGFWGFANQHPIITLLLGWSAFNAIARIATGSRGVSVKDPNARR